MSINSSRATGLILDELKKALNAPPCEEDSSPTLSKPVAILFWLIIAGAGISQVSLMLHAMENGFGYTYVLGWVAATQLLWAVYYMLAGLKVIPYILRYPWMETILLCALIYAFPFAVILGTAYDGGPEYSSAYKIVSANSQFITSLVETSFFNDADLSQAVERIYYTLFYSKDFATIDAAFSVYMIPLVRIAVMIVVACQICLMHLPLTRIALASEAYFSLWHIILSFSFTIGAILAFSFALFNPVSGEHAQKGYLGYAENGCIIFMCAFVYLGIATGFRRLYMVYRLKKYSGDNQGIDVPPV